MLQDKPPPAIRLALLAFLCWFARLEHNPIVYLEARLGLSPSPLERLFGIRGIFSGMTEATHRLSLLDPIGAMEANVLVVPILGSIGAAIAYWKFPRLDTRRREVAFFGLAVAGTAINNLAPAILG